MRNKDTGEFELVIGDKQLLSGFFIGIVLLAVVFVMGYMMGRGTHSSVPAQSETAGVVPPAQPDTSTPAATPPAASADPQASTPPASTPADTTPTFTATEPPPQPTTVPARDSAPPAAAAAPAADLANASYWQVTAASSRNSADAVSQTLQNKGFPASTRPGPNNLTLVWVGPYTDKESLRKAKQHLEEAGFNPIKKP